MAELQRTVDGPFLAVAFLCEKVLTEQNGTNTYVRVVDRVTVQAMGPAEKVPAELPHGILQLVLVVGFKSGAAKGRGMVDLTREKPSGQIEKMMSIPVLFEGEERGNNIHMDLTMEVDQEGLYWFAVDLDGQLVTKLPLRVLYQPLSGPPRPS